MLEVLSWWVHMSEVGLFVKVVSIGVIVVVMRFLGRSVVGGLRSVACSLLSVKAFHHN